MSAKYECGKLVRFPKHNVHGLEFSGTEHERADAPGLLLLIYLAVDQLAPLVNQHFPSLQLGRDVGHQLAVSTGDGSGFPLHTDNTDPEESKHTNPEDRRKLSVLFYLNPNWRSENGGQIRLYPLGVTGEQEEDDSQAKHFEPETGILLFWSDLIYHDTIPTQNTHPDHWRYTLTLWMMTDDPTEMHKVPALSDTSQSVLSCY